MTALYALALMVLRRGFRENGSEPHYEQPSVTIIVAARNEQEYIARCLQSIRNQSYPKNLLQTIVVDDRSTDRTAEIVESFAKSQKQMMLLRITDVAQNLAPKKRAIDLAIRRARGEIIFTTDADCQPGPNWIAEMVRNFKPEVGMVAGYNPYQMDESLFSKMLALDYFAMASVAAASAGLSYPTSCSGGNLAYRRRVYFETGGFQKHSRWISGDDDFFLETVRGSTNWKIRYANEPTTFVPTAPPETLRAFVQQRIRYASKCANYSAPITLSLIGVYFLNLLFLSGAIAAFFQPTILLIVGGAFLFKSFFEYHFLSRAQQWFQTRHSPIAFVAAAVVHPIYIVVVGLLGRFSTFQWKGEVHAAQTRKNLSDRLDLQVHPTILENPPHHV